MNDSAAFSEDLDKLYENSLQLANSLMKSKETIYNAPSDPKDSILSNDISKRLKEFRQIRDKYLPKLRQQPKKISLKAKRTPVQSKVEPLDKSHRSAKLKLQVSLLETNREKLRVRAGASHRDKYMNQLSQSPPLIQRLEKSNELSASPVKLPNVSWATGKVTPPLHLPSFREFSLNDSSFNRKTSTKTSPLDKVHSLTGAVKDTQKLIKGLEIFYESNPGVQWNRDKSVLLKLYHYPQSRTNIIRAYNARVGPHYEGFKLFKPKPDPRSFTPSDSLMNRRNPAALVRNCSSNFRKLQNHENSQLELILEKVDVERPVILRKKLEMVESDKEKYRDPIHSLNKFQGFTKQVDIDRQRRVKQAASQIDLYKAMLTYLKNRDASPQPCELVFTDSIKEMLESGWPVSREELKKIILFFQTEEQKVLEPLLGVALKELGIPENDFKEYLQREPLKN